MIPVRQTVAALRMLLAMTVLTGLVYPLAVWLVGQGLFGDQADGSLLRRDGVVVGSSLIGQRFDGDQWFQPRASAGDYDAQASGASNLGPESAELVDAIEQRRADIASREGVDPSAVPPDAVTASGSGLDPFISPAYADLQVARVADATGLGASAVQALVDDHTQGRSLGFLGQPRVNVVELNLALADAMAG